MRLELEGNKELRNPSQEDIKKSFVGFGMNNNRFARLTNKNGNYIQAEGLVEKGFTVEYADDWKILRSKVNVSSAGSVINIFVTFLRESSIQNIELDWYEVEESKKTLSVIKSSTLIYLWAANIVSFFIFYLAGQLHSFYLLFIPLIIWSLFLPKYGKEIWVAFGKLKQNDSMFLLISIMFSTVTIITSVLILVVELLGI